MPTSYTSVLADGCVTFEQFASRCARNFVSYRDDPLGLALPDKIEADAYYLATLREAMCTHDALMNLPKREHAARARAEYVEQTNRAADWVSEKVRLLATYEGMLRHIDAWEPPTADHAGLKEFMRQQVTESIRFDCDTLNWMPKKLTGKQWYAKAMQEAEKHLEDAAQRYVDAQSRARANTVWVEQLRESLK